MFSKPLVRQNKQFDIPFGCKKFWNFAALRTKRLIAFPCTYCIIISDISSHIVNLTQCWNKCWQVFANHKWYKWYIVTRPQRWYEHFLNICALIISLWSVVNFMLWQQCAYGPLRVWIKIMLWLSWFFHNRHGWKKSQRLCKGIQWFGAYQCWNAILNSSHVPTFSTSRHESQNRKMLAFYSSCITFLVI